MGKERRTLIRLNHGGYVDNKRAIRRSLLLGLLAAEDALALADVGDAGPDGEDSCDDAGVNGREGDDFEHDPAEGEHLGDGADFAGPVGNDFDLAVVAVQDFDAAEDDAVAQDDDGGKPEGEVPAGRAPIDEGEGDDAGEEEGFVSDGVDVGAKGGALVEAAGDPAVDAIGAGGGDKHAKCPPAHGFQRLVDMDGVAIVKSQRGKHGDQTDPCDGDFASEGHALIKAETIA
jgi:hypothetical protein